MSELKDPAIKLFGKTITLSNHKAALDRHLHRHEQPSCSTSQDNKNNSGEDIINLSDEESIEPSACETPKTPDADTETLTTKEDQSDDQTNTSNEKALKKPDKIIPCPRCNSMETKFCYYNNYNVNQPRHFCKKCQRYWTAGGTMRNVPVGSGRRKNKNACSLSYRQIMGSDSLQGDVESNETSNGAVKNFQGFPLQIPSYPGGAWPWSAPVTPHPYSPIGFPMGFYPATPYWGCTIQNPWISPPLTPSSPSTQAPPLNSPILGKHYRDGSMLNAFNMRKIESREEKEAEKSTLLAKELRIDDSNEDSINGARVFKTFLPKFDERIQVANTSLVLQANPAAFSRSINFQEST